MIVYLRKVYYKHFLMTYTALPSVKGQITIPSQIREKYKMGKNTPVVIEDSGKGIIIIKVMGLVAHDAIEYYENAKEYGINFKKGVNPEVLIDAIKKLD